MWRTIASQARRFADTCIWSWRGWLAAWASEISLRQWTAVNFGSGLLAFYLDITSLERALILALGLLILAVELVNTAIEEVVDLISPGVTPGAGKAKDCGSAAVALTAMAAGVAWIVILIG